MHTTLLKAALGAAALACTGAALADVTFYESDNYNGRSFTVRDPVGDFRGTGFNDRASSVVVTGSPWEVCDDAGFRGHCYILRPGNYPSLRAMNLNDRISSARAMDRGGRYADDRWAPPPPGPSYETRPQEQLFQAQVLYSHAMYGPPEQRCWIEQREVRDNRGQVGGAVIGGILGGILGHQIGRGGGVVGAVGGAVVGSAIGSQNDGVRTADVQRCGAAAPSGPPQFWDTAYTFQGQEHHVQTTAPPGPTITVNGYGEPRI